LSFVAMNRIEKVLVAQQFHDCLDACFRFE
jgi:hypothetical protein